VLVEADTYRYFGHSKSDRNLYRSKDEIEQWRQRDPIERFRCWLIAAGHLEAAEAAAIETQALDAIERAAAFAEASPDPDLDTLTEFVYA
jgi:TPP-dependent pyruvate/acetoin dehydrogenase alpha subunit